MTLTRDFTLVYLGEALSTCFADFGYSFLLAKRQFRLDNPTGFKNVIFSVSPYEDAVWLEFHFGVRIHAVEDIVQRFTRSLPGC